MDVRMPWSPLNPHNQSHGMRRVSAIAPMSSRVHSLQGARQGDRSRMLIAVSKPAGEPQA
jgi:hypothetical protein